MRCVHRAVREAVLQVSVPARYDSKSHGHSRLDVHRMRHGGCVLDNRLVRIAGAARRNARGRWLHF